MIGAERVPRVSGVFKQPDISVCISYGTYRLHPVPPCIQVTII